MLVGAVTNAKKSPVNSTYLYTAKTIEDELGAKKNGPYTIALPSLSVVDDVGRAVV